MKFTDDDLKRLKENIGKVVLWHVEGKELKALLARLEAAEAVMPDIEKFKIWASSHPHKCTFSQTKPLIELWEAWRKAAGK